MVNTPIYDYLMQYAHSNQLRMHMPGHKGKGLDHWLAAAYPLDITEICGADSLFEADGIIAESENNAAVLFGAGATLYSAGGSTLCIQAMLMQMKREGRTILAGRNVHRSMLNTCILLDLPVRWMYPKDGMLLSGAISAQSVQFALANCKSPACVYITTPDYLGTIADIKAIATICARHNARLIVDNAHGAHLAFIQPSLHPIALGADFCCDSYHKMLPALTGAACLHCKNPADAPLLRSAMAMFGSTSPSYLILASIDLCNRYLDMQVRHDIATVARRLERMRNHLRNQFHFRQGDPFHICICAGESGYRGTNLAAWLTTQGIMYEYADADFVVMLCSPTTPLQDIDTLQTVLEHCNLPRTVNPLQYEPPKSPTLFAKLPPYEAAAQPSEIVPIHQAVGRICAMTQPPCPPAVPIAICGEILDDTAISLLLHYGVTEIAVIQEKKPSPDDLSDILGTYITKGTGKKA